MEGQTVAALIEELKKCDQEKLIIVRAAEVGGGIDGMSFKNALFELVGVEETPENVYIDVD